MSEQYTFADGKYTLINDNGVLTALRNGEPWGRDLVGDNLVYWMFVEVLRLKAELDAARGPVVREHFEDQCMTLMRLKRENGQFIGADNGVPVEREALFWRKPNGQYGVEMFNAAWQGYQWGAQR